MEKDQCKCELDTINEQLETARLLTRNIKEVVYSKPAKSVAQDIKKKCIYIEAVMESIINGTKRRGHDEF